MQAEATAAMLGAEAFAILGRRRRTVR
ncbi:MYXO-CTERM sorting domain-containing protein [Mesorhizobium sp. M1322]